ncbi:nucleotidyl transferase AbiEii/AbiGii toxin family protein [Stenotrophomonas sp.]|uniref:nucleotidyl transferase AbiEii/AbiGii toxin family protein n=1 Tax=Stenotrophomonas sp. TaxID=69392 RepID=UPI0028996FD1|nr:nucleotidyl transferase AbiEii/AbiGii toxin family protein [Stenotrophomonas sp.]
MAENLIPQEPQSAADYDDRTTAAVKTVLVEIGQILGSFKGKFAVIGGAVPWLLLANTDMPHVGTLDLDLGLDAEALGDGEYATLITSLMGHGYQQHDELRRFQLVRQVPATDGGGPIDVIVDFLMPRDADIARNKPPLIENFAVQRADGADLASHFYEMVAVTGSMPTGGTNRVEIAVCSIPALLAMKGYAIEGRHKQKDAYDIYYCIRNYPGGTAALAEACRPVLERSSGAAGYRMIAGKFDTLESYGPTSVRLFVEETAVLGDRTPEQWQQDAFGQVDAWLRALGLKD